MTAAPQPDASDLRSVYRIATVVATHPDSWARAGEAAVADLAKSIDDLRIATVIEKDIAQLPDGERRFRVKLAVSYRLDRRRVSALGELTTVRRYLVVADETLSPAALRAAVLAKVGDAPSEFHVVAPIQLPSTNIAYLGDPISGYTPAEVMADSDQAVIAAARERLADSLEQLRASGGRCTGELSATDPLGAVLTVLDRGSFDEILVSTSPSTVARWLHLDLPHRLARHTTLPVTHVGADAATS